MLRFSKRARPSVAKGPEDVSRAQKRLRGGHFRFLNELMYTKDSQYILETLGKKPEVWESYHEGYRLQVAKWRRNPLDIIIYWLKKAVPKNYVVADIGCGEGALAPSVPQTVHSFDFFARAPHVVVADAAALPLPAASVDVAVFCLSLMGVNWPTFILEARRVLKKNGILKIAESSSRLPADEEKFLKGIERLGFARRAASPENVDKFFTIFEFTTGPEPAAVGAGEMLKIAKLLAPCVYRKRKQQRSETG